MAETHESHQMGYVDGGRIHACLLCGKCSCHMPKNLAKPCAKAVVEAPTEP